jgi:hypothetical protein
VRELGFEINGYHIHFRGICAECRREHRRSGRRLSPGGQYTIPKPCSRGKLRGSKQRREP